MKACPHEDCGWVFHDASRNRSGQWCSMAVCGNRTKGAAFRARLRAQTS
jgi:predicted RNA-binding Zn ribbon-like protein